jgi:hypothetical protein
VLLAIGWSYIDFILLRYIPSIPCSIRAFIKKGFWKLSKVFLQLLIQSWFFSLFLFMCYIIFIDFSLLSHPCIPENKQTWYGRKQSPDWRCSPWNGRKSLSAIYLTDN